jgi:3-oxoacyl-[acyl-carrier-protein] synthase-3
MHSYIAAIEYFLPERTLSTDDLEREFPTWNVRRVDARTGIHMRHIAAEDEYASDLAAAAAGRIFQNYSCQPHDVEFLLLCTQSPDYILPTTACLLQHRLGLPTSSGALDVNLGCSGFVYALSLAEGLIASKQVQTLLLVTADTYSKYIDDNDRECRLLFGDAAAAVLIKARDGQTPEIGPFEFGTDGSGASDLIVHDSGTKRTLSNGAAKVPRLFMDGPEVFQFALRAVPNVVQKILQKSGLDLQKIDRFVFHQANLFLLEQIRQELKIDLDKFQLSIGDCGNTVSSSIPIALKRAEVNRNLRSGDTLMLVGFGVGYSWAAGLARWNPDVPC